MVSSPSVFVLGGGRGPVSFRAVKGKGGQSALELCSAGNGGESALELCSAGNGGESALELCSAGNGGESASGAVKGEGGPVSFGVCSSSVFVLRRAGGPVSFRGCEGGNVLSQLWSLVVVASPSSSVFVLGGAGASQLPGL